MIPSSSWPSFGTRRSIVQQAVRIMFLAALQPCLAKTQPAFRAAATRTTSRRPLNNNKLCVGTLSYPTRIHSCQSRFTSSSSSVSSSLPATMNQDDIEHMSRALEHARGGFGKTFPNPAVGCVLVRQDTNQVIGAGFHPRAGFPHAEVFALLEAAGHVESGVEAAQAVIDNTYANKKREALPSNPELFETVQRLTEQYSSPGGPQTLFAPDMFLEDTPITAYVTLEPCCHTGKTPPCAASLVATGVVSKVVVGVRDPNPRVDGGGVKLLQDANMEVDMFLADDTVGDDDNKEKKAAETVQQGLAQIVADFVKRITPRTPPRFEDTNSESGDNNDFYSYLNGAMRRALRSHAMRKKTDKTLTQVDWNGANVDLDKLEDLEAKVLALALDPSWLERIDRILWEEEVVSLRLTKAIKKKKGVKYLGERIAKELQAHVAQTVGHTVLLYRPGIPPVLDLATLGDTANNNDDDDQ